MGLFDMLVNGNWEPTLFKLGEGTAKGLSWLFTRGAKSTNRGLTRGQTTPQVEEAENERLAGCRSVVMSFLNTHGYMTRECMSREELEEKIDSGIQPADLAQEIYSRIMAKQPVFKGVSPALGIFFTLGGLHTMSDRYPGHHIPSRDGLATRIPVGRLSCPPAPARASQE
jgi:hypothetical protein